MASSVLGELSWDRGRVEVWSCGAAIHNLVLLDCTGRSIRPLAEAPWQNRKGMARTPEHLQNLGGEWPCVPFGTTQNDSIHHGYGSDNNWELEHLDSNQITSAINYPRDHPVKRVRRTVAVQSGLAKVSLWLEILVRRDCRLPIGLHPIFRLLPGTQIFPGEFSYAEVFPGIFEPGVSRLEPGDRAEPGQELVNTRGERQTPLADPFKSKEELIQLWHTDGSLRVSQPGENSHTQLTWNPGHFPHLLVWISNKGRQGEPWNGQFRGIGLEPINSYFDANDANPVADSTIGIRLSKNRPFETNYSIQLDENSEHQM